MSKINLAKALKVKNSLINEITRAKAIFARENSRKSTSTSLVDRAKLWEDIANKTAKLIALKGAISSANVGIYPCLARMEEAKSSITYLQGLNTTDGVQIEQSRYGTGPAVETRFDAYFTQEKVDERIAHFQKVIEEAQDEVDAYNATTLIEYHG